LDAVPAPQPRRLTAAETAAITARPWPRLPWWLWLVVAATTATMVAVAVSLVTADRSATPLGAGRSPPAGQYSHDVGDARIPALEEANRARLVRRHPTCPRLTGVTLVGTQGEVDLLAAAADQVCGLRTTAPIDRARQALDRGATVVFAEFRLSGNESTSRFGADGPVVLVNGKFSKGPPERVAVLLVHEGTHLAAGGPPDAAAELAADRAQDDACRRLFAAPGGLGPNRSCLEAASLLAAGEARALDALRAVGYR
jgi:hypothetical protein